jgi:hypothetical protein
MEAIVVGPVSLLFGLLNSFPFPKISKRQKEFSSTNFVKNSPIPIQIDVPISLADLGSTGTIVVLTTYLMSDLPTAPGERS